VDAGRAAAYRAADADARRILCVEITMLKSLFAAALTAAVVVAGATMPSVSQAAQGIQVAQASQSKAKTTEKKLTPQQQKMKDCAAQWNARKDKTKVKGRKAYNDFMSGCLKKK